MHEEKVYRLEENPMREELETLNYLDGREQRRNRRKRNRKKNRNKFGGKK